MLALAELTAYLLEHGHLDPGSVVDGALTVVDASRRNSNVVVRAEPAVGLFIKQGRPGPVQSRPGWTGSGSLAHEAAVYRLLDTVPRRGRSGGVSAAVPQCLGFDADRQVLILESLPDALDLAGYHSRFNRFPVTAAARVGAVLADLHVRATPAALACPDDFPGRVPWVLGIDRPGLSFYCEMSNGGAELVRMLQSSPGIRTSLAALRAEWRSDSFIHHDLKADNCLLSRATGSGRRSRLAVVDWEFADLGDAGWDIGSVFGDHLARWAGSIPVAGTELPDHFLELAGTPLARIQPAMHAFWAAYRSGRGWSTETAERELIRSARFAGVRLLQTAYERVQGAARVTATVVCLAQLAENVLTRPAEAVEELLGIRDRGAAHE